MSAAGGGREELGRHRTGLRREIVQPSKNLNLSGSLREGHRFKPGRCASAGFFGDRSMTLAARRESPLHAGSNYRRIA